MVSLQEIVDYLYDNHDKMFVLPSMDAALVYDRLMNEVVIIWGDFSGTPVENAAELRIGIEKSHAWLN